MENRKIEGVSKASGEPEKMLFVVSVAYADALGGVEVRLSDGSTLGGLQRVRATYEHNDVNSFEISGLIFKPEADPHDRA